MKHISRLYNEPMVKKQFTWFRLMQVVRQKDDPEFANLLNNIRFIPLTNEEITLLQICVCDEGFDGHDCYKYVPKDEKEKVLSLQSHWKYATPINIQQSKIFKGKSHRFVSDTWYSNSKLDTIYAVDSKKLDDIENDKNAKAWAYEMKLKVGQPVMILKNINFALYLVNGMIGNIVKISRRWVNIRLHSTGNIETVRITKQWFTHRGNLYTRQQLPLRPSFCMTIHKGQGQTTDRLITTIHS